MKENQNNSEIGLVLSGGGARGAYQAGVLAALAEISGEKRSPFKIITGVSAGAINAAYLAAYADDIRQGTQDLRLLWEKLRTDKVFETNFLSLSKIGLRWIFDLGFGGVHKQTSSSALLDTSPLNNLLKSEIPFSKIKKNIDENFLNALAITAIDYATSESVTFMECKSSVKTWSREGRYSVKSTITAEHMMASAAIPILFSPERVGDRFFGDGSVRNSTPLSPAIHLGCSKLITVSVKKKMKSVDLLAASHSRPSVGRILSVVLNAVLMDRIDFDMERLIRINNTLRLMSQEEMAQSDLKPIDFIWIQPSQDISEIAKKYVHLLPSSLRYFLRGLGELRHSSEIVSYLLFESDFCKTLTDLGYRDAMTKRVEIEAFLK